MQPNESTNSEVKYLNHELKSGCHNHAAKNYIKTVSGKKVHVYSPRPEEILLEDGAWALSHIPRFNGNTVKPYSVLAHLIWCYLVAASRFPGWKSLQKACLFHDFHEAYIGDMASPIKQHQPCYHSLERRFVAATKLRFDLSDGPAIADQVKQIDTEAFYIERDILQDEHRFTVLIAHYPRRPIQFEFAILRDLIETTPAQLRYKFHKIYSEEFCK